MTDTVPTEIHFDVIVADGFVLTELAGVIDPLRIANRVGGRPEFTWTYRARKPGLITSGAEACVEAAAIPDRPDADYVVAIGNADPDAPDLSLGVELRKYAARQTKIILLSEAASRYIADKGITGQNHTTHWENRQILLERYGLHDTRSALVVEDGGVMTCAGMGATLDAMLSVLGAILSAATMTTITDILLHERVRHHNTLQPFSGGAAVFTGDANLDLCIGLMQKNTETPLSIAEISAKASMSKRSLERKFHRVLRSTPNGYYRELRLSKANNLLLNTDMAIHEIALACGFPSGFAQLYKRVFGMTPNLARQKGRRG